MAVKGEVIEVLVDAVRDAGSRSEVFEEPGAGWER